MAHEEPSLGIYPFEGMVDLSLPFTATNNNEVAWARFGTSTLFEARLLLLYVLVLPNSTMLLQNCIWDP